MVKLSELKQEIVSRGLESAKPWFNKLVLKYGPRDAEVPDPELLLLRGGSYVQRLAVYMAGRDSNDDSNGDSNDDSNDDSNTILMAILMMILMAILVMILILMATWLVKLRMTTWLVKLTTRKV